MNRQIAPPYEADRVIPIPRDQLPSCGRNAVDAAEKEASRVSKRLRRVEAVQLGIEDRPGKESAGRFAQQLFAIFRKRVRFVKAEDGSTLASRTLQ